MFTPVKRDPDVMPAQAGTHATIYAVYAPGVDPRLRGDDRLGRP
jgi:hypothetical protein